MVDLHCLHRQISSAAQQAYCCAEGVLWQQEVQDKVACYIAKVDDMLQPIDPLLAALRYLSLLYHGRGQDATDLLRMKRSRKKAQADEERAYYPYMLAIFQVRACETL